MKDFKLNCIETSRCGENSEHLLALQYYNAAARLGCWLRGTVKVCGDAGLLHFWCSFAGIFILSCGLVVLPN